MEQFPESAKIGICHNHSNEGAFPNFYAEQGTIYRPLAAYLAPLMIKRNQPLDL